MDMNCKEIQKRLSAYLDDELTSGEKSIINKHLRTCQMCQKMAKTFTEVDTLLTILSEPEPKPYFYTRLRLKIPFGEKEYKIAWIEKILFPVSTAAVICLGIFIGTLVGKNGNGTITQFSNESEIAQTFYLDSFNDFPASSLGEAYFELTSQTESQEGGVL